MADALFSFSPAGVQGIPAAEVGRVPAFDFDERGRGAFRLVDGALVERSGVEAVKQWFALMLRQPPGAIPVYRTDASTALGVDRTLLQKRAPLGFITAEIERQVRETAAFNPAVRTVDSFSFTRLRRGLQVEFTAHLRTGEDTEVTAYVNSE